MMKRINNIVIFVLVLSGFISCDSDAEFFSDTGTGGSMARFTIVSNTLYTVDYKSLSAFDIASPENPVLLSKQDIGFGIETIFPYRNNLFIGSQDGMYIYDLQDQDNPSQLSRFLHVLSCDPVVVQGDIAYVTLRSGGDCRLGWGNSDQLDIIDISNLEDPKLIQTHFTYPPYGLAIDNERLFICHGEYGLGMYNVGDPQDLVLDTIFQDVESYDVITYKSRLMVIGEAGFYQYDYSEYPNLELLSSIKIGE